MKQTWSIVVFCFNEEGSVESVLKSILAVFDTNHGGAYEIVVVDDGSTDNSLEKIENVRRVRPEIIRVLTHEKNKGIGITLRDGYTTARYENICAVPADGQFDVNELIPFLNIEPGTFVSFFRKENVTYSSFRMILSSINKYLNRYLNGISLKDVNWVKIYKRADIQSFPWKLSSSLIESEICAKLLIKKVRVIEVLSYYHERRAGKSKGASFRIVMQALSETLFLILVIHQFRKACKSK